MNSIFAKALLEAIPQVQSHPGDYQNQDGLLCCGVCHEPKQMRLNLFDEERLVPISCRCQQEQEEHEEAERKANERRAEAYRAMGVLRELSLAEQPAFTFAQNDNAATKAARIVTRYAERFEELADKNVGLMLYGPTGSGKTFYAHCIAAELLEHGHFAWLTNIRTLAERMNDDEMRSRIIRALHRADLLILDDFGAERSTSYMTERCYDIINERYNAKKPMIITTNLDPSIMMQERDLTYRRIYDRVNGMCTPVLVDGVTRRKAEAVSKMIALKDILGLEE